MDAVFYGFDGTQAKITLGLGCNNDCRFCYNRLEKAGSRQLEEERVLELIDEAAASGASHLNLIGGEVTILPYFVRALRHARGRFPAISVNTNGRAFADEAFARDSVEAGLSEVDVSLHGSRPEVHDAVSGAAGACEQTVAGLRNLVALARTTGKPLVSVTTIVLDANVDDLDALARLLREIGVSSWRIKYAYGALGKAGSGESNDYILPYGDVLPVLRRVIADHGDALQVIVHDVPSCLLGELLDFSTVHERHKVARYTARGLVEVVRVLDRWGETASVCESCEIRGDCCRPSAAYVARFGEGDLRPTTRAELEAVHELSRAFRAEVLRVRGDASRAVRRQSSESAEMKAIFQTIDAAAREGRWGEVRRAAARALELAPEDAAATLRYATPPSAPWHSALPPPSRTSWWSWSK